MKNSLSSCKGGSFLTDESLPADVFTPEDCSDDQRMIRNMTRRFVENEVLPQSAEIERQNWELTKSLLKRCGDLGLLGIEVPERYGGEGLDKVSATIVIEELAGVSSFSVMYGAHAGIGTLPIVYFGSENQKRKYLPRFCSGELFAAYALSESGSGSDALSAKTVAARSRDGRSWLMNGEKMWVTNAAFADVFVTFAQVDENQLSCFLVERDYPGVSTGVEERKMGLDGCSTCPLVLENVQVPIGNLLGEIGKGQKIAFNTLNMGRAKLAAHAVGASRFALNDAIQYAKDRVAFGRPISSFGAIRHKIAEMAIRTWVTESMVYRTSGLIDRAIAVIGADQPPQAMRAIEEYAIECSIVKVFGTEALDFVVDETVQVFGGYGYSKEYRVEQYYRDARVYRIFEGTNEINRLLIPNMLLRRASTGRLPLDLAVQAAADAILSMSAGGDPEGEFGPELRAVGHAKTATLSALGCAVREYGDGISEQQEVLMHVSDMIANTYALDTCLCRFTKHYDSSDLHTDIVRSFISDTAAKIERSAQQVFACLAHGERLRTHLGAIRFPWTPTDTVRARQRIAEALIESGQYML